MQLKVFLALLIVCFWRGAAAQSVEADVGAQVFHEGSASSDMTVYTPEARVSGALSDGLTIRAAYQADVVSGASERVKAGPLMADRPDIVSRASVRDVRHIASGGLSVERPHARVSVGYTYGVENDYQSNALTVAAASDFFQRNTDLEMSYSRGWDRVCTPAQSDIPLTLRRGLVSSGACFTDVGEAASEAIALDNFQLAWTQAWTPVLTTQVVATGSLQHGFLGNPYREVVIGPTGQSAQENHPRERRRAAASVRTKYYSKALQSAWTLGLRAYRDSWQLRAASAEIGVESYLDKWLRAALVGRAHVQSGASFWSDDYTGGEPQYGPRGAYWTGDRELSPLKNLMAGVRLTTVFRGSDSLPVGGIFRELSLELSAHALKTYLDDFSWAGEKPDDTLAILPSLSISGQL